MCVRAHACACVCVCQSLTHFMAGKTASIDMVRKNYVTVTLRISCSKTPKKCVLNIRN